MSTSFGNPTVTTGQIEFLCTSCGRSLKVATSAAGKRASCPQCNAIVQVPLASNGPGPLAPPATSPAGMYPPPQPAGQPIPLQLAPQQTAAPQPMGHPLGQPLPGFQQPGFQPPTYQPPP